MTGQYWIEIGGGGVGGIKAGWRKGLRREPQETPWTVSTLRQRLSQSLSLVAGLCGQAAPPVSLLGT